jgi:hypothetical protein
VNVPSAQELKGFRIDCDEVEERLLKFERSVRILILCTPSCLSMGATVERVLFQYLSRLSDVLPLNG